MSDPNNLHVAVELRIGDGEAIALPSLVVREGLSRCTHASAVVATQDELDVAALIGSRATVTWLRNKIPIRTMVLIVGEVAFDEIKQASLRYRIELFNPFWTLKHTRGTRKFRNLSADEIITQVLTEAGVEFGWNLSRTPPKRKYCLQYRESHHDFVCRLLEHEGIYFVSKSDGSLAFEDTSTAVEPIEGAHVLRLLNHEGALIGDELGVHDFGWGSRVGTGKVTVNDYNWKTPDVDLLSTATGDIDAEYELYEYPVGYRKPSQGVEFAQMRLEAARARTRYATGTANVVHFAQGRLVSIEGDDLLLLDVDHQYDDPSFDVGVGGGATYTNTFEAIPLSVRFRPPVITPKPSIDGCHTAMVRGPVGEEIHTDRYGRFKAQFHWDREGTETDDDSRWLRKLQEGATSINLARVGWEVSVAYVDGDPDRPLGLARNINGAMMPAYAQPANKPVMTIKTPTYPGKVGYNELKLDDRAGDQRFDIRAELDMINRVNHDKTETIGNDQTHVVDLQLKHRVERDQTLTVGGNQSIDTASNFTMSVLQNRDETIGGDQRLNVTGSLNVDVGANQTEHVGGIRLSVVGTISPPDVAQNARAMVPDAGSAAKSVGKAAIGGAQGGGGVAGAGAAAGANLKSMVPTPAAAASQLTGGLSTGNVAALAKGSIDRNATNSLTRTVGAVHLAVAGDDINVNAQYVHAEVVGGLKLTVADGGIAQSAGEFMALTVGGAMFKMAGEDAGYGAKVTEVTVGGLIKLNGDEQIELSGLKVRFDTAAKLEFRSGGLAITLTPGGISVEGSLKLEAGGRVVVTGQTANIGAA